MLVALLAAYGAYREYVHAGALLEPAVITRNMNAHAALSPGVLRRAMRLLRGAPAIADRPKLIALTFDDGPYPVTTPLLLDVLDDLHVKATFFIIGRDAQQYPELARRIAERGHEIANHTLTHPNLDQLDPAAVTSELDGDATAMRAYTDDPAVRTMMRPPHGRYTLQTIEVAQRDGYDVILWNDDPGDWRAVTPAELVRHVEEHATAPEIVLLHNGRMSTIEMLPEIVARYRAAGYAFVTVGDLLARAGIAAVNDPAKHPL